MAQLTLTVLFLVAAVVFVLLDHDAFATALLGAVLGQGAAVGVRKATNGTNGK